MDPILVDAVCRAMFILETSPLNKEFDQETLSFLQDLYVWRRPEKFLVNGGPFKFVSGCVSLWSRHQRCLQFTFDNGYIWEASISKLGTRTLIRHCRDWVRQHLEECYLDIEEAA